MSKIEVNAIEPQCGTNLTVGASGDTITFPSGTTVVNNGSQTGFGRTGTVDWDTTAKTASFTAVSGNGYFVNTAGGTVTVTLPATPSSGDIVSVSDYNGTAETNTITIARNGSNINGDASDYVITKAYSAVTFVYVDGTVGWTSVQTSSVIDNQSAFIAATGGTVTCCGDYKIHTFTGPGTFTVTCAGNPAGSNTVDYLIVAGGGGGSGGRGGGGGAGGYRESSGAASGCYAASPLGACVSALPVTAQGYPITVGGGGSGSGLGGGLGCAGSNSVFSTITSAGGGGGTQRADLPQPSAKNGGSGGGSEGRFSGTGGTGNTPPVSPPQGNNGGNSDGAVAAPDTFSGGGGGGAGAAGSPNPSASQAGAGGAGVSTSISGSSVARAGGGGGGSGTTSPAGPGGTGGAGGSGGGGAGGNKCSTTGTAGTTNTGGGGGGGGLSGPGPLTGEGGAGGSGIVIIRYRYQ